MNTSTIANNSDKNEVDDSDMLINCCEDDKDKAMADKIAKMTKNLTLTSHLPSTHRKSDTNEEDMAIMI